MKFKTNNKEYVITKVQELGFLYYVKFQNMILASYNSDPLKEFGTPDTLSITSSDIQCLIDNYSYNKEKKVLFDII